MENKKISFGFNKISKKPDLISKPIKEPAKLELIDCLEGKSIKIKDAVEEIKKPLIIPMVNTTKTISDRIKEVREKREKQEVEKVGKVLESELTLDELAARELIREAQNRGTNEETKIDAVVKVEDTFIAEGADPATLEDYESIPISQFGMAMLKGMGWKEGMPIGKSTTNRNLPAAPPELRPKGLGLGAYKMIDKDRPKKIATDENGKELKLCKNGYCKVISGRHKGSYGYVEAFDENCRVVIKTSTGEALNLNDFLVIPVTQKEFSLGSKIINNAKYEQYKDVQEHETNIQRENDTHTSKKIRERSRSRSKSRERHKHKSKKDKTRSRSKRDSRERSHRK